MAKRTYSNVPAGASTPTDLVWIAEDDGNGGVIWKEMDRGSVKRSGSYEKPTEWYVKHDNLWKEVFNECFCNTRGQITCSSRTAAAACTCNVFNETNNCPNRTNSELEEYCNCHGRSNACDCRQRSSSASCCCNQRGDEGQSITYPAFTDGDGHDCACNLRTNTCLCMEGTQAESYNQCRDNDAKTDSCDGCECKARTYLNEGSTPAIPATACTQNFCSCVSRGHLDGSND